jgi:hypothetical protein
LRQPEKVRIPSNSAEIGDRILGVHTWRLVCDVALDLLKRHSGIVWDPGRFRGIAPLMLRWIY